MKIAALGIIFFGIVNSASALTEVQRVQRVYADLNQIADPSKVSLNAVILKGNPWMINPPYSIQGFIRVWNEYQNLGFPSFDTGRAASIWEQGKICTDESVQCAALVINTSRIK